MVINPTGVAEVWKKDCQRLLNEKRGLQEQALLTIIEKPQKVSISAEQVEAAPNKMKTGEAAGEDGITVDIIKAVGDTGIKWIFIDCYVFAGIRQGIR